MEKRRSRESRQSKRRKLEDKIGGSYSDIPSYNNSKSDSNVTLPNMTQIGEKATLSGLIDSNCDSSNIATESCNSNSNSEIILILLPLQKGIAKVTQTVTQIVILQLLQLVIAMIMTQIVTL